MSCEYFLIVLSTMVSQWIWFVSVQFLFINYIHSKTCSKRVSFVSGGTTTYSIKYYCCANSYSKNGRCETCPIGYTSESSHCLQCKEGFYGEKCALDCFCQANERCDNEYGCINTTTKNTGDINTKFENKESIIYIGCVGLLTFVVIILLTYICCIRTRKKTAFENAEPKHRNAITSAEKHVLHWTSDKNMIDETLYDEIDDKFLCDIKANEEHKMIADEDDDSNQSTKDVNDGYLNPYQPIISTEVDVHQYSSTKNEDDNSTTSDENQRDSGYLHPYQSLKSDISETKHEYTGLETNEYRYTRNQHGEEIIATEMGAQ